MVPTAEASIYTEGHRHRQHHVAANVAQTHTASVATIHADHLPRSPQPLTYTIERMDDDTDVPAYRKAMQFMSFLLREGASADSLHEFAEKGQDGTTTRLRVTALFVTVTEENAEAMAVLIKCGADVNLSYNAVR